MNAGPARWFHPNELLSSPGASLVVKVANLLLWDLGRRLRVQLMALTERTVLSSHRCPLAEEFPAHMRPDPLWLLRPPNGRKCNPSIDCGPTLFSRSRVLVPWRRSQSFSKTAAKIK